jgi:hypothetical protein
MRSSNRRGRTENGGWVSNSSGYSIAKPRCLEIGRDNSCCNGFEYCFNVRLEKADFRDTRISRIGCCLEVNKILEVCTGAGVRKSYCNVKQWSACFFVIYLEVFVEG